jgi:hypothetical protein
MDDIDRQILIMELEDDFNLIVQEKSKEYEPPSWFKIGMGIVDAPEGVKFRAKEIYKEFLKFKAVEKGLGFEELVKQFTLMKTQNRI